MITVEKILVLRSVSLFQQMPPRELAQIAEISQTVVCSSGARIFSEGDFGDRLYVIVEGAVSIVRGGRVVKTLRERDYFGEMSILDGEPRSASALAEVDSLLLEIQQERFHEILAQHFEAALGIIKTLSQRIRRIERDAAARDEARAAT